MDDTHGGTCNTCGKAAICSGQDPEHIIELTDTGWTLQHSLACRLEGELFDCPINKAVQDWMADLGKAPAARGRWYVTLNNPGDSWMGLVMRQVE